MPRIGATVFNQTHVVYFVYMLFKIMVPCTGLNADMLHGCSKDRIVASSFRICGKYSWPIRYSLLLPGYNPPYYVVETLIHQIPNFLLKFQSTSFPNFHRQLYVKITCIPCLVLCMNELNRIQLRSGDLGLCSTTSQCNLTFQRLSFCTELTCADTKFRK